MGKELTIYEPRSLTKEEKLEHIYIQVASGRAVSRVLDEDEGMPSRSAFWVWHMNDETIQDNLARARENGVEALMDEAMQIADTPIEGVETTFESAKGVTSRKVVTKEMLGHRRLQIDTRIQYARMIKPRKYGAKLTHDIDEHAATTIADALVAGNKRIEQAKLAEQKGEDDANS